MRTTRVAFAIAGGALLIASAAPAQTLINGSFETGPDPGAFTMIGVGSTAITGWTVIQSSIDYIGTGWEAAEGDRSIDLGGGIGAAGGVEQDITTEVGQSYEVRFALAGNYGGAPIVKTVTVSAAGASQDYLFDTTGRGPEDMGWTETVFVFTATGSTTTLRFTTLDANYGPAIDDVRIVEAPIPVPATGTIALSILALGLGGMALGLRQRARTH